MRKFSYLQLLLVLLLSVSACVTSDMDLVDSKQTIGWIEEVKIYPIDFTLDAKIDTGADTCSVHAENIKKFTKNKKEFASFEMLNRFGKRQKLERQIVRYTKIKTKKGGFQVRPVVKLGVCLDKTLEFISCNLVDRSNFQYPVLVGRNYLAGKYLVNASASYLTSPECED